jgi:chromosome segregation ATPase
MSLEADLFEIRKALPAIKLLERVEAALADAVHVEGRAAAGEKKLAELSKAVSVTTGELATANAAVEDAKREASKLVNDARKYASEIKAKAKDDAEKKAAKADADAAAIAADIAVQLEKFAAQKQTNDEILAMTQAQIAHAEAKLSEIRAAIAKITGG